MFKLNPAPTFVAQVPLSVPGKAEPVPLSITFKHKGKEALYLWLESAREQSDDHATLSSVIDGWSGLLDEAGGPVPYSADNLQRLLDNYPSAAAELFRSYTKELSESKRKNF